jgi:hypothetical protein
MAFITTAVAWLIANWALLFGVAGALISAGAVIAKITPSPKDDRVFAALLRFLNLVPVPQAAAPDAPAPSAEEPPIMGGE